MNRDVTFLINSCDKYEDAWHPFFECLWHFAGDLPYPIVLNLEKKQYTSSHYALKCVNTPGHVSWSKRLLHALESVDTDFVFFLLEDYFLQEPFDRERFETVIQYMKNHPDVCIVDIKPRWSDSLDEKEAVRKQYSAAADSFLERNSRIFNITCAPGIWRTSALRSLIRTHEDVWDFERYVGLRAKKNGWKVVRFDTRTPGIYEYEYQLWSGMGITAGHWLPKNKEFFDSLGIEVNYQRLGTLDAASVEEVKKTVRKDPFAMLKKIPRKIRKKITRKKSLN